MADTMYALILDLRGGEHLIKRKRVHVHEIEYIGTKGPAYNIRKLGVNEYLYGLFLLMKYALAEVVTKVKIYWYQENSVAIPDGLLHMYRVSEELEKTVKGLPTPWKVSPEYRKLFLLLNHPENGLWGYVRKYYKKPGLLGRKVKHKTIDGIVEEVVDTLNKLGGPTSEEEDLMYSRKMSELKRLLEIIKIVNKYMDKHPVYASLDRLTELIRREIPKREDLFSEKELGKMLEHVLFEGVIAFYELYHHARRGRIPIEDPRIWWSEYAIFRNKMLKLANEVDRKLVSKMDDIIFIYYREFMVEDLEEEGRKLGNEEVWVATLVGLLPLPKPIPVTPDVEIPPLTVDIEWARRFDYTLEAAENAMREALNLMRDLEDAIIRGDRMEQELLLESAVRKLRESIDRWREVERMLYGIGLMKECEEVRRTIEDLDLIARDLKKELERIRLEEEEEKEEEHRYWWRI